MSTGYIYVVAVQLPHFIKGVSSLLWLCIYTHTHIPYVNIFPPIIIVHRDSQLDRFKRHLGDQQSTLRVCLNGPKRWLRGPTGLSGTVASRNAGSFRTVQYGNATDFCKLILSCFCVYNIMSAANRQFNCFVPVWMPLISFSGLIALAGVEQNWVVWASCLLPGLRRKASSISLWANPTRTLWC